MVVLEYVPNSLRSLLRGVPLDLQFVVNAIADVCAGMIYVASRVPGFVHRDLKPENILIDAKGRAKVTDFGLATISKGTSAADRNAFVGTPLYMAPEQVHYRPLSVATDIYAAGCILFEMVAGLPVYGFGKSDKEYFQCHVEAQPPDVRDINSKTPTILAEVIRKCLSKDPSERYFDFKALRQDIQNHVGPDIGVSIAPMPQGRFQPSQMATACQGLINLGFREDASKIAEEVIALEPEGNSALMMRILQARVCSEDEKFEEAMDLLRKVKEYIGPDTDNVISTVYHTEAGRAAHGLGQLKEAISHFEKVTKLSPQGSVGWHNLASMYIAEFRFDEAIQAEKRAIGISPDLRYFFQLASIFAEQKCDYTAALQIIEGAISEHPHLYQPYIEYIRVAILYVSHLAKELSTNMGEFLRTITSIQKAVRRARQLGAPEEHLRVAEEFVAKVMSMLQQTSS
jgi:tetratricopeptide (TPR) repeat protein